MVQGARENVNVRNSLSRDRPGEAHHVELRHPGRTGKDAQDLEYLELRLVDDGRRVF